MVLEKWLFFHQHSLFWSTTIPSTQATEATLQDNRQHSRCQLSRIAVSLGQRDKDHRSYHGMLSDVLNDGIWCLLRLTLLSLLTGEKGGERRTVRAAGMHAPRKTVLFGGVSGVMSRAGLVPIGRTRTTHVHSCPDDPSKCATGMCLRTMSGYDAYQRSAVPRYPSIAIPTCRSPVFASSFSADRTCPHDTQRNW
jgi:hypothetical protein